MLYFWADLINKLPPSDTNPNKYIDSDDKYLLLYLIYSRRKPFVFWTAEWILDGYVDLILHLATATNNYLFA